MGILSNQDGGIPDRLEDLAGWRRRGFITRSHSNVGSYKKPTRPAGSWQLAVGLSLNFCEMVGGAYVSQDKAKDRNRTA